MNVLFQAIQGAVVAGVFLVAIFLLRLDWFFPIVAGVGVGVAVLVAV